LLHYKLYRNTECRRGWPPFVRGGEANETQTFVDGIRVAQPYNATIGNVPTRGRFSPFCSAELLSQQEVIQLNMARRFLVLLKYRRYQTKQNRNLFNDRGCRIGILKNGIKVR
jgi:hypothetical protein